MAFYDYKCRDCGNIFEIEKGMNDNYEPKCPSCKSSNTARKFNIIRRGASKGASFGHESREMSGSCSSCSSGACSTCNH